jgi:hypothetical protein
MHLAKKILKLMMKERQVTTGDLIIRQFDGGKKDVPSIEDNGLRCIVDFCASLYYQVPK